MCIRDSYSTYAFSQGQNSVFDGYFRLYTIGESCINGSNKELYLSLIHICRYKFKLIDDIGVKKQFETIKKLIDRNDISEIINCGDADREGEVSGRLIIENALEGQIKPIKRLWLPEQTHETIRYALKNLDDSSKYDLLYDEGLVRTCVAVSYTHLKMVSKYQKMIV